MAVVVPLNLSTIENPPDNLEPRRRAQLAVLKHLFTLNCDWTMETAKVGELPSGIRPVEELIFSRARTDGAGVCKI